MKLTILNALTLFLILAGVALTIFGLSHTSLPWDSRDVLIRYFVYLLLCFSLTLTFSVASRKSPIVVGAILAILIATFTGALGPLLVVAWIVLASTILGRYFLSHIGVINQPAWAELLVGAGLYGTTIGLLAHFPVNYPEAYGLSLLIPIVLGWRTIFIGFQQVQKKISSPWTQSRSVLWLESSIVAIGLVHFVVALMPEVGYDALAMHLFVPVHIFTNHQWGYDPITYVWAVMPMLGDWLFTLGYMLAGETASRFINVGFIFLLAWLILDLVKWAGGTALSARWAALIFLSTPLTFTESSSLFIESVWTSFMVAGTIAVLKICSDDENQKNNLILAGTMLGFALAAKLVTVPFLVVLFLFLILRYKIWFKSDTEKTIIVGLGLFFIFGAIPYITSLWMTGNPVFPFFNGIFKSPLWPSVNFDASAYGKGVPWDFIYGAIFDSGKYLEAKAGAGGFQWLLLFLPVSVILIFNRHWKGASLIAFVILTTAIVFHSTAYLRYIFPAYVVLAAAIGVGISVATLQYRLLLGIAMLTITLNVMFLNAGAGYGDFSLDSILNEKAREHYLATRLPIRNAVNLTNELNKEATPVAVFANPLVAGLKSDALYVNWYNNSWQLAFFATQTDEALASLLNSKNVNYLIIDSHWNASGNVSKKQLSLLEHVSTKISQFGSITVRRFNEDYRLMDESQPMNGPVTNVSPSNKELLINPEFSETKGWALSPNTISNDKAKILITSVTSPASQTVPVSAGQHYRNTVIARCYKEKTQGRVQVNWSDSNGQFIQPDIQVFDCTTDWHEHSIEVTAPTNSAYATVYATGHTGTFVEFKSVSFKR